MRTALISDLHTNLRSRAAEWARVSAWLLGDLRRREVDLIKLGGDLFEMPPTMAEEDATAELLLKLADIAPVVGPTGNHDIGCPVMPRRRLPVDMLQEARHPIKIVDRPTVVRVAGAAVACMPWPRSAHLLAAMGDAGPAQRHQASVAGMRAVLLGLGADLALHHGGPRILLAHCHVRGVTLGAHVPEDVNFEAGVEDLASVGASFVGLGHIHKFQAWSWNHDGRPVAVVYPGSPYRTEWGEVEPKGYVIADWSGANLDGWQFVETPATPMVLLECEWDPRGFFAREGQQLAENDLVDVSGAEVRFRFRFDADQAEAAKRAAEGITARMVSERGAARAVPDEDRRPSVRARMPEITTVEQPSDQLVLWARGQGVDEPRAQRLRTLTGSLEGSDRNVGAPAAGDAARLRWFRLHKMGPFDDVTVNLDELDATVIAVCGDTGEGKTSLLELGYAAPLYRKTPTQGTVADRARARTSYTECGIGDYTVRQSVDAHTGKPSTLLRYKGEPVKGAVESGDVSAYDAWATANLMAPELFFASAFGAQGNKGLGAGVTGAVLSMTKGDRKSVVLRALGIESIETLAERAGDQLTETQRVARDVAKRLENERARATPLDVATDGLTTALAALQSARDVATQERATCGTVRKAAAARDVLAAEAQAHGTRLEELRRSHRGHVEARDSASRRRTALVADLADVERIRTEAASVERRRAHVEELRRAVAAADAHAEREAAARGAQATARNDVTELEARRSRAATLLGGADTIRSEAARVEGLRTELAAAEAVERAATTAAATAEQQARAEDDAARAAATAARDARASATAAGRRADSLAGAENATRALPALRMTLRSAVATRRAARARVKRLADLLVEAKDIRITGLRETAEVVATWGAKAEERANLKAVREYATGKVQADTLLAAEHAAAPEALTAAERRLAEVEEAAEAARRAVDEAERLAARRAELDTERAEQKAATAAAERATADGQRHQRLATGHRATAAEQSLVATQARSRLRGLREALDGATLAAGRLVALATAEATIAGLDEQIGVARRAATAAAETLRTLGPAPTRPSERELSEASNGLARADASARRLPALAEIEATGRGLGEQIARENEAIARLEAQLAELGPLPDLPEPIDVEAAERAVERAERSVQEAVATHTRADSALRAAREAAARIHGLETELREAEELAADWALVARGLGPDGIQALLLDAAGPELTRLANDLMRHTYGSRYTISISTTRPKKTGGDKEVFDVLVYDAQNPQDGERDGRLFSEGQRVIIGEAVALALAMLSYGRAGLTNPVLVRDETAAPLDHAAGRAYVTMLRRAAELLGASKVLFVSHDAATWNLADARLVVRGGQVEVVRRGQVESDGLTREPLPGSGASAGSHGRAGSPGAPAGAVPGPLPPAGGPGAPAGPLPPAGGPGAPAGSHGRAGSPGAREPLPGPAIAA